MTKVLISDKLHPAGVTLLEETPGLEVVVATKLSEDALCGMIADVDALVVRSGTKATRRVLEAAPALRVIGRAGIGVDNIDVTAASSCGVLVMNAPTGNSVTTAEHALSMLMALARRIPQATASMKAGRWEKSRFMGKELFEKTLGVIGFGNIGRLVAARAQALGMHVVTSDPYGSQTLADEMNIPLISFETLLERADFITIHAPLTPETHRLIDAAAFARMKRGMLLVCCARGGIVDEAALTDALEAGIVDGAALDVFATEPPPADHPLLARDDVICTPHLGASTTEAQKKVAIELTQQVANFLTRGEIRNALNLAAVRSEA